MPKRIYKNGGTRNTIVDKTGYARNRKETNKRDMEYKKNNYTALTFRIRNDETEILERLNSVPNKTEYIIELIRKDIADK